MHDVLVNRRLIRCSEVRKLWNNPASCKLGDQYDVIPDLMPWRITRHSSSGFGTTIIVTKEAV